jgi:long-subunit fatty acid transport protein
MIGYKVNNWLSTGVIIKNRYTWADLEGFAIDNRKKYEYLDFGAGLFVRARIVQGLFAHVDFERTSFNTAIKFTSTEYMPNVSSDNKLIIGHTSQNNGYVGLGWSSGFGKWQSQIGIYKNITNPIEKFRDTWDYRLGLSYNF